MKFSTLETHLSPPRIQRYLRACNSKTRAIKLYAGNLQVARDFHPLLGILEVVLRNRLYDTVTTLYQDPDWIINQTGPQGFMSNNALKKHDYALRRKVARSIKDLTKKDIPVTGPSVLAEQMFGFWTDLFEPHHFGLLRRSPILAFTNLPAAFTALPVPDQRHNLSTMLNKIRLFRNRINHNEPVVLRGNLIDLTSALDVYNTMIDIFNWLDPNLIKFIKPLDKVQRSISRCQNI